MPHARLFFASENPSPFILLFMTKKETSYGILALKKRAGVWRILLLKHGKGHWAFPKGHAETHEEPVETAMRELKEETGLEIARFFDLPPFEEHYFFRSGQHLIDKTVCYFAAEVKGRVVLQEQEISDYLWLPLEEAIETITFKEGKKLCAQLSTLLNA